MEYGSIEREIHVKAPPEVVFEVITQPEHLREWWPDEVRGLEPQAGAEGEFVFRAHREDGGETVVPMQVLEITPPRLFRFRWSHEQGQTPDQHNSMLVTFALEPGADGGTIVSFSETGFRERGWEEAKVQSVYENHAHGWALFLPRLQTYGASVASAS